MCSSSELGDTDHTTFFLGRILQRIYPARNCGLPCRISRAILGVVTKEVTRCPALRSVGVRELKEHTSELLREVSDRGEEIQVTSRGKVIARLLPPLEPRPLQDDFDAIWADMDRLAEEIGKRWPEGVSGVESLSEDRR